MESELTFGMYDMETAGEGEDEVAFFADETQLGVGEYMVVVEESHHPESELRPGSEDRYVEIDFQGAEDQNGQFVGGASTSKIDAISKNATQVMVVKDLDSEEFEDAEGQRKRVCKIFVKFLVLGRGFNNVAISEVLDEEQTAGFVFQVQAVWDYCEASIKGEL